MPYGSRYAVDGGGLGYLEGAYSHGSKAKARQDERPVVEDAFLYF
jgi:hypothetical protein